MIRYLINSLLHIIKRYKLWPPIGIGAVCVILYIRAADNIDRFDSMYDITRSSTRFLFFAIWGLFTFIYMREVIYRKKTGRTYAIDKMKYDRSFFQLIDYYKDADPYQLDPDTLDKENWQDSEGIILGRFKGGLIRRSAFENGGEGVNVGVFGIPGSGKTAAVLILTALVYGGSVFCIDIKGDILRATHKHRRIRIFAPDDPDHSCHYNPMSGYYDLTENDEKIDYIETMAAILVPEEREKYWYQTGRALFCGICFIVLDKNPRATLPDIARAALRGSAPEWIQIIRNSDCELAKLYTDTLYKSSEINLQGAFGSLGQVVRPFVTGRMSRLLNDDGEVLSTADLDNGYDIYIEIPQNKISTYSFITTIIVQQFMDAFMDRPDITTNIRQQPVLFMLDEFPRLHFDFETISDAMSTLRSKCISIIMAMQSIAQIIRPYGSEACQEFVDLLQYFAILRAQNPLSREFFQKLIGDKKVLKATSGGGSQEAREYIFQSADFANLGDNIVVYDNGKYILAEKIFWYKDFDKRAFPESPSFSSAGITYDKFLPYDDRSEDYFLLKDDSD